MTGHQFPSRTLARRERLLCKSQKRTLSHLLAALLAVTGLALAAHPALADDPGWRHSHGASSTESLLRQRYRALQKRLKRIEKEMSTLSGSMETRTSKPREKAGEQPKEISAKPVAHRPEAPRPIKKKPTRQTQPVEKVQEHQDDYDKAYRAFLAGDYDKAERQFLELLKRHPHEQLSVSAHVWLAEIYNSRGDHDKALEYFERAQSRHERGTAALNAKAETPAAKTAKPAAAFHRNGPLSGEPQAKAQETQLRGRLVLGKRRASDQADFPGGPMGRTVHQGSKEDFVVNVGDRVFFETDQSSLTAQALAVLKAQVEWLEHNRQFTLTVEGHADERGTREYNIALGAKRADTVRAYFIASGIKASRIRTISYGKERPVALCDNISCWAQNRRAVTRLNGGYIGDKPKAGPSAGKNVFMRLPGERSIHPSATAALSLKPQTPVDAVVGGGHMVKQ